MNVHSCAGPMSTVVARAATALSVPVVQWFKRFKIGLRFSFCVASSRHTVALDVCMATAKDFTELIAWQRADDLDRFVQEIIKRRPGPIRLLVSRPQTREHPRRGTLLKASAVLRQSVRQLPSIAIGSKLETRNQILEGLATRSDHGESTRRTDALQKGDRRSGWTTTLSVDRKRRPTLSGSI